MDERQVLHGPTLRQAAAIAVVGYALGLGVPFASFRALPRLFDPSSAAQTSQNILAHQGLFVAAMFAFLLAFVGDVVAACGLYWLLRPVSASVSMLAAALRVVFATMELVAVLDLAIAHRLLTGSAYLTALGRTQLDAQVQVAVGGFHVQNAFSLIVFGVHLVVLGWLVLRSRHVPRWLGAVLAINGAGWSILESGPYLFPGVNLDFVWITTAGELFLLVWLVGWGTRLREATTHSGAAPD
jgi:hypothetical protein